MVTSLKMVDKKIELTGSEARVLGDAFEIEAGAKRRLADEYDGAQR